MDVVDYCKIINGPKTVFLRKRLKNAEGHAHDVGDHLLEKIVLRQIHSVLQFRLETCIKTRFSARAVQAINVHDSKFTILPWSFHMKN